MSEIVFCEWRLGESDCPRRFRSRGAGGLTRRRSLGGKEWCGGGAERNGARQEEPEGRLYKGKRRQGLTANLTGFARGSHDWCVAGAKTYV